MRNRLILGLSAVALAAGALPQAAFAGKEDRARAAVAAAQAKIETGDKQGVTADAADQQARARVALVEAQHQIKEDEESRAYYAAQEAIALADLAMATSEYKKLVAERDRLASR